MTDEPPTTQELRVHGVGGSHGSRMLGFDSIHEVVVVGEGLGGTSILARREDPSVESYDWGNLTSGTGSKPFWVFLLPFTLINLAGWMHPPEGRAPGWVMAGIRGLVHTLSGLLTATYVFTFGIILVDLMGYQWTRRLAAPTDPAKYPLPLQAAVIDQQRWGVYAGLVALAAVVGALIYTAGTSQAQFEKQSLSHLQGMARPGSAPWKRDERLSSQQFFFHPNAAKRRFWAHFAIAGVAYLLVASFALTRLDRGVRAHLDVGELLSVCSGGSFLAVLALWLAATFVRREAGEHWARSGPAIAATLAFGLVNAVVSGAVLLLIKQLNKWPARPFGAPILKGGPEVNLVDVWGGLLIAFALAGAVLGFFVVFRPRAGTGDITQLRSSPPGCGIDGLDESMRKSVARSRYLATLAHRGSRIAFTVALTIYAVGVIFVIRRVEWNPYPRLPDPDHTGRLLYQVGAYVLPALALLLVQLVRKGRKGARTFASTLWDVFTFWPRRFSPLAVRPYSERAVPELQGRILHHTQDKESPCPLVLGVHSQGSVLAFAALSPLEPTQLKRIALVTYGCPISTIYSMFFPAYFGRDQVVALRDKLPVLGDGVHSWQNFYRLTDPIGGPILGAEDPQDTLIPDPFPGPAQDLGDGTPPLERDAPPWLRVSGHSYYMQEPVLKTWLRAVRKALDRP